jgi:tetratricopeptide (TPR) repeat protein
MKKIKLLIIVYCFLQIWILIPQSSFALAPCSEVFKVKGGESFIVEKLEESYRKVGKYKISKFIFEFKFNKFCKGRSKAEQIEIRDLIEKIVNLCKGQEVEDLANYKKVYIYVGRGRIYDLLDMNDKAIENYELAIKLESQCQGVIYHNWGHMYARKKMWGKAIRKYELAINKGYIETFKDLGIVYHDQQKYKQAIVYYTRAIKESSEYFKYQAYCNRGVAYREMGLRDGRVYVEVLEDFFRAMNGEKHASMTEEEFEVELNRFCKDRIEKEKKKEIIILIKTIVRVCEGKEVEDLVDYKKIQINCFRDRIYQLIEAKAKSSIANKNSA